MSKRNLPMQRRNTDTDVIVFHHTDPLSYRQAQQETAELFSRRNAVESAGEAIFAAALIGQYRPDVMAAMLDSASARLADAGKSLHNLLLRWHVPAPLIDLTMTRIIELQDLTNAVLSGQDSGGEGLRVFFAEHPDSARLTEALSEHIDTGGRPQGKSPVWLFVGREGLKLREQALTAGEIADALITRCQPADALDGDTADLHADVLAWLTRTRYGRPKTRRRRLKDISEAIRDFEDTKCPK